MERYLMGIDYGTLSARAVVVRASDGKLMAAHTAPYAHGVITGALPDGTKIPADWALASARDYEDSLIEAVRGAMRASGVSPDAVEGLCVDATSCTLVPTDENGTALSLLPGLSSRPHAHIKLWKHHAAQAQAARLSELAAQANAPFFGRCGMAPSCEWTIPKLMQMRQEDYPLYQQTAYALDLCDYLTWRLTGRLTRGVGSAGFKSHYIPGTGYPDPAFLDQIAPGFGAEYHRLLSGPVLAQGACAGGLTAEMARSLGLRQGTCVACGAVDGHTSLIAMGLDAPGDATLVVGTSNVLAILSDHLAEIPGVCGIVLGGAGPQGLYGVDTGQSCTGDMLHWYMKSALPKAYALAAEDQGVSPHEYLSSLVERPWENALTVLDWWAGNRNVLCDLSLTGSILGLTLAARPEDIYCAMLHGIACGTRHILERCAQYGVVVKNLVACGGIPCKNPFFMQQYANILGIEVQAARVSEGPAVGAAIYAAAAAGVYPSLHEAQQHMRLRERTSYRPDLEHADGYEAIYRRHVRYHDLLGGKA